jgi:hypothetical protein
MDANGIALTLAGLAQPFIQEAILRNRLDGKQAHLATLLVSLILAAIAIWVTGGFAGAGKPPTFSLLDPSPLLAYVAARWAPIYALSQVVYGFAGGTVQKVAGTA